MTILLIIAAAIVLLLAAGSVLTYIAVLTAPEDPTTDELEDRIQHGPDGTADNGTKS